MQYLGCLRNVHAPGRDFIDLEISTLLYTLHGPAAAEQLRDVSLPLGLFRASATACWPTTRVNVTCVLCCSPRLRQGQSANLTAWVSSRQHKPVSFLALRGWRPWLRQRWVHPARTLLPLHHRSAVYFGYRQLSSSSSAVKSLLLPPQCSVSEVCIRWRVGKVRLFFPYTVF